MVQLPVMDKLTSCLLFFILFLFSACNNNADNNLAVIRMLDAGYTDAVAIMGIHTDEKYRLIEDRLRDLKTEERAKYWLPRAQQVKKLSADMSAYIDNLRQALQQEAGLKPGDTIFNDRDKEAVKRLFIDSKKGDELYRKLAEYEKQVLSVDLSIDKEFKKYISFTGFSYGSAWTGTLKKPSTAFVNLYFTNISTATALAVLSRMKYYIKAVESQVVYYCDMSSTFYGCNYFTKFSIIAGLSSSYIKAGDSIMLYAGVGEFSLIGNPKISIHGKPVTLNDQHVAMYKFKPSTKPGKYTVPVEIRYTDQDGVPHKITKELPYAVAQ